MYQVCRFCQQKIHSPPSVQARNCLRKDAKIDDAERCWVKSGSEIQKLCARSTPHHAVSINTSTQLYKLLKRLGNESLKGRDAYKKYFISLSPFERSDLINYSVDELKEKLVSIVSKHSLDIFAPPTIPTVPKDLAPKLTKLIEKYLEMLKNRYRNLLKKGHDRSKDYIRRESSDPIKFISYLNGIGFNGWEGVGNKHLVSYLSENNAQYSNSLKRFIKYANKLKNPFNKVKASKPKKSGTVLTETPKVKIVHPEVIDQFLDNVKKNRSEAEYLLAWLVSKMGLSLKKAYETNIANIAINDDGECVFKPAQIWIRLPSDIEKIMIDLADDTYPEWKTESQGKNEFRKIFPKHITHLSSFSTDVLQGRTKELRSSAIFALIFKGHTDRTTLKQTIGVSMPTIVRLESLLSADMHRQLEPEFIELRNLHIMGKSENED